MSKFYCLLTLLFCACSVPPVELPPIAEPAGPEEPSEEPAPEPEPETPEPEPETLEEPEELNILQLPSERCAGHWADNSDSSTRFTSHPDTGLCTFACVWEEPRCKEAWYGDPRCFPAHAAVLGVLCAETGGTCELNEARTNRYCVYAEP